MPSPASSRYPQAAPASPPPRPLSQPEFGLPSLCATISPGSAGILRARLLVFHGFQIANCPPPANSAPSPPSASGLPCVSAAASTPPGKATAGPPSPPPPPFFYFSSAGWFFFPPPAAPDS